jgi:hypothetical protein
MKTVPEDSLFAISLFLGTVQYYLEKCLPIRFILTTMIRYWNRYRSYRTCFFQSSFFYYHGSKIQNNFLSTMDRLYKKTNCCTLARVSKRCVGRDSDADSLLSFQILCFLRPDITQGGLTDWDRKKEARLYLSFLFPA